MAHYVVLGNWTEQGIKSAKESPKRVEAVRTAAEALGGKMVNFLYTMGAHDFVVIFDFPSDEAANELLLKSAAGGNVRTTTLKGWTASEFEKLAAKL